MLVDYNMKLSSQTIVPRRNAVMTADGNNMKLTWHTSTLCQDRHIALETSDCDAMKLHKTWKSTWNDHGSYNMLIVASKILARRTFLTHVKQSLHISNVSCSKLIDNPRGAAVAEWLSSWLAKQEDRGSILGLATWIFRDWLSPASKSRYGWKIAKSTLILFINNQQRQSSF